MNDELKYKTLHETNPGYQNNNWMLDEIDFIRSLNLVSILEVGCGNGKFLEEICNFYSKTIGIDLVRSPLINPIKYQFYQKDVYQDDLPFQTDLLVSADVMEHFREEEIPKLIEKFSKVSDRQFHIIACYDDGYSHETIKSPDEWLKLFACVSDKFQLRWIKKRKERNICLISNF